MEDSCSKNSPTKQEEPTVNCSMIVKICQLKCSMPSRHFVPSTQLLAVLGRHNFEIKPVSISNTNMLYICVHRTLGADQDELEREMSAVNNGRSESNQQSGFFWDPNETKWSFA